jgi:Tfp pilus assembly protein PilO
MNTLVQNIKQRISMQTLLLAIAAFLFLLLLILPKGKEIYQNKHRLVEIENKITTANSAIQSLPQLYQDLVQVRHLLSQKKKSFILQENVGDILLLADLAVESSGAFLHSIDPDRNRLSEPLSFGSSLTFQLFPVDIYLKGTYRELVLFLNGLCSQEKLFVLDAIKLETSNDKTHPLECRLSLQFFLEVEEKNTGMT